MKDDRLRQVTHRDGLYQSSLPNNSGITTRRNADTSQLFDNFTGFNDPIVETQTRIIALNQPLDPIERPKRPVIPVEKPSELTCLFSYCGWTNFLINGKKPIVNDGVMPDYQVTQYDLGPLPIASSYCTELKKFAAPIYSQLPYGGGFTYWTDKPYIPETTDNTINVQAYLETLPDNFYASTVPVLRYQFYDGLNVQHPLNSNLFGYDFRPLVGNAKSLSDSLVYNFDMWIRVPTGITSVVITGGLTGEAVGSFSANYRITTIEPDGIDASNDFLIDNASFGYQRYTTEYIKMNNGDPTYQALLAKGINEDNFAVGDRYYGDFDQATGDITNALNIRNDLSTMLPFEYNFRYPTKYDFNNDPQNPYYVFRVESRLPVRNATRETFAHTALVRTPFCPTYFYPDHPDYFPGSAYSRPTGYKEYRQLSEAYSKPITNATLRNSDYQCWNQTTTLLKSGVYGYSNIHFGGVFADGSFNTTYGRWEHLNDRNYQFKPLINALEIKPDATGYIPHSEIVLDRFRRISISPNVLSASGTPQPVLEGSYVRVKFWVSINHLHIDELRDDTFSATFGNNPDRFDEFFDPYIGYFSYPFSPTKPALSSMPSRPVYQNASWMTGDIDADWDGRNEKIAFSRRTKLYDCYLAPLQIKAPIKFEVNLKFS